MNKSDEQALADGCYFDDAAANKVKQFIEKFLCHSKGEWAGKPFHLLEWQWLEVLRPLFGWKQANGLRRFSVAYLEVPKKQGKSCLLSAICLYMLVADGEKGAEIYCCAADKDQAGIIFDEAANMVSASPLLSKRLTIIPSKKRIVFGANNSYFRALSSEVKTKEGFSSHCTAFDELHAQDTRKLWDVLRYAGAARRQPLLISITTAGYDKETICWEQHEYARKVLSGEITDPSFFGLIYAAADDEDWTQEETWKKANPSYGITINGNALASACNEAKNEPRKENSFRRYRLNQWVGTSDQWLSSVSWESCATDFTEASLYGRECVAGLDLARKHDLGAIVYLFPEGDAYYLVPRFFMPKNNAVKKEIKDRVPYLTWERSHLIKLTEGDTIDFNVIRQTIIADSKNFKIKEIGFDPWNAEMLCRHYLRDNDGFNIVEVNQTPAKIAPATSQFERLVKEKKIKHNNNPILNWNAMNCVVSENSDKNYIMLAKGKATGRIDGISAAVIALSRAFANESDQTNISSIYNTRGILAI